MWESFKEYVVATGRWGWLILVDVLLGAAGAYLDISGRWGVPTGVWVAMLLVAFLIAPFMAFHKVRRERDEGRNEVADVISELESATVTLGERSVSMATLFWRVREGLLNGMQKGTLPGGIGTTFEGAKPDEVHKAWGSLVYRLRLLQLIDDRQRQHGMKGYMEMSVTPLGISVLRELEKRWRRGG